MKKRFLNKMNMYDTVKKVCNEYQGSWAGIPAFSNAFAEFTGKLIELSTLATAHERILEGISADKVEARELAAQKGLVLCNALKAFAKVQNNHILEGEVSFTISDLRYGSYIVSQKRLQFILDKAIAHEQDLADFGITQTHIAELQTALDDLAEVIAAPRVAITSRKHVTQSIKATIKEIDDVLKGQMDQLMTVLFNTSPEFFNRYHFARNIIDLKGSKGNNDFDNDIDIGQQGPPGPGPIA